MRRAGCRRRRGATIAELGAALVVLMPLMVLLLFVAVEVTQGYMISTVLSQSAEQAARQMALQWAADDTIEGSKAAQDMYVYDKFHTSGVIQSSDQFETAKFTTDTDPKTVSVTVTYLGGQYGLKPFPSYDPLHLGSGIKLSSTATYRLE